MSLRWSTSPHLVLRGFVKPGRADRARHVLARWAEIAVPAIAVETGVGHGVRCGERLMVDGGWYIVAGRVVE